MKIFDIIANFVFAIVSSYSPREGRYHKPLPTITERAGFKINESLLGEVLKEKYKQKYLPK